MKSLLVCVDPDPTFTATQRLQRLLQHHSATVCLLTLFTTSLCYAEHPSFITISQHQNREIDPADLRYMSLRVTPSKPIPILAYSMLSIISYLDRVSVGQGEAGWS